jgi:predicted ATP-binding protein involved in virulence
MKQKSAVEWLLNELTKNGFNFKLYKKEIKQAKEIENQKQQKYNEMLEMLKELCNDTETWSHLFPSQQEKIEQLIKEATEL